MANQVWLTPEGVPYLNGLDYEIWRIRMEAYIMTLDVDVWFSLLNAKKSENNVQAKRIIMKGLSKPYVDKDIVSQQRKCWTGFNVCVEKIVM